MRIVNWLVSKEVRELRKENEELITKLEQERRWAEHQKELHKSELDSFSEVRYDRWLYKTKYDDLQDAIDKDARRLRQLEADLERADATVERLREYNRALTDG